jgi:CBS domain containing-hemolysin-like protein
VSGPAALLLAVALLAANAFFVGAEFALISARRTQIEPRAAAGSRAARRTLRAMENVSLMMAGAQLGITICSLGLGAIGEPAVAHLLEPLLERAGLPDALLHPLAFAIALTIVVGLHVVIGEMVPKNIALARPERAALVLGPALAGVVTVLKPLIVALNATANAILRLLKVEPKEEITSAFTREQVSGLIDQSRNEGLLDLDEYTLLAGALGFRERTVQRVLLGTDKLVSVPRTASVAEVEALCASSGYSRIPVVDDQSLVGYVHIKDLLETDPHRRVQPVAAKWIRPLATVSLDEPLHDALEVMKGRGAHLARVADAAGNTLGVVTLEDVLAELVGEIRDATTTAHGRDQPHG